jgi:hypothetical protein
MQFLTVSSPSAKTCPSKGGGDCELAQSPSPNPMITSSVTDIETTRLF